MILDDCHSTLKLKDDFDWGSDVIVSTYKPKNNVLLLTDLQLHN